MLRESLRHMLAMSAGIIAVMSVPAAGTILDALLSRLPPPCQNVVSHPDRFGLQIIYTQIDRDVRNRPHFNTFRFHVDPNQYFYPASLVKLPAAALALEKINTLGIKGLSCRTPMRVDNALDCLSPCGWCADTASVESSVKCMLIASDNGSYNRLWEFLTRDYADSRLKECGYGDIRLLHRFSSCAVLQNRVSNSVRFMNNYGKPFYIQPQTASQISDVNPLAPVTMGSFSYYNGVLLPRPFRADNLNYASLEAVHRFCMAIMFPSAAGRERPLKLSPEDYRLLHTWMCLLPRESGIGAYVPDSGFVDNFKKYLLFGDGSHPCTPSLREFNVVGRAYGFLSDVAYFADFDARVEFFLSAVVFANEDDIVNDDRYEYDAIALPFFSALGAAVYEYEKTRYRRHRPDLRELKPSLPAPRRSGAARKKNLR
jgi:hypothetical protein